MRERQRFRECVHWGVTNPLKLSNLLPFSLGIFGSGHSVAGAALNKSPRIVLVNSSYLSPEPNFSLSNGTVFTSSFVLYVYYYYIVCVLS